MFIGLCGGKQGPHPGSAFSDPNLYLTGACAGKQSVADYLITGHGFRAVTWDQSTQISSSEATNGITNHSPKSPGERRFPDFDALLNFVTAHWKERWLITDIANERVLDACLRRPFFLLISIDAPILLRWQRHKARYGNQPDEAATAWIDHHI